VLGIAFVLLVAVSLPARSLASPDAAPPVAVPARVEPAPAGRWYGWEPMLTDAVFLLVANDGRSEAPELGLGSHQFALGLGALALGAPALHFVHGNKRRAVIGLAARAGIVGIFAFADDALRTSSGSANVDIGSGELVMGVLVFGAVIGGAVFAFVDDIWHARLPPTSSTKQAVAIVPTCFVKPHVGGIGLLATF